MDIEKAIAMTPETCKYFEKNQKCATVCACNSCTKNEQYMPPKRTQFDKLMAEMTVEKMAEIFNSSDDYDCINCTYKEKECPAVDCVDGIMEFLNSEVNDGK